MLLTSASSTYVSPWESVTDTELLVEPRAISTMSVLPTGTPALGWITRLVPDLAWAVPMLATVGASSVRSSSQATTGLTFFQEMQDELKRLRRLRGREQGNSRFEMTGFMW